jgi:hypothetical protein
MRELHAGPEALWRERHELLDDIHAMANRIQEVASGATGASVSAREAAVPADGPMPEPAGGVEDQRTGIGARDAKTGTMSVVTTSERGDEEAKHEAGVDPAAGETGESVRVAVEDAVETHVFGVSSEA